MERGSGTPVIFLHGYPLNHTMWLPQLEDFSADHHVGLLDLPGYGLARDSPVPETLAGFAGAVHETVTRRFSTPVVVVGHSFGGYISLLWYRDHPEQFRGLVLTNTRAEADSPEVREKRLATAQRLEDPAQSLDVEEVVRGLLAPATWEAGGSVVGAARAMVQGAPSSAVRATLRALAGRPDLTEVLARIRVPTLVVWGEEDHLIPPAQSQSLVPRIDGSVGAAIPGAGHLPSLEAPKSFSTALRPFLDRISVVGTDRVP
ncbi:MAG: alpha/beta fold hydrolase [Thermoplasmata archaeon]